MVTALGGRVKLLNGEGTIGPLHGGGMSSKLAELPTLPGVRQNIEITHLKGADARRATPTIQSRVAFDFSTAVFIHPEVAFLSLSGTSSRTSTSHFLPLCRLNTMHSEASQADRVARPKEVKAEKAAVIAEVT